MSPSAASTSKRKKFAEESGLSHLLSLSHSITDAQSQLHQHRIDSKKNQLQAIKLKKQDEKDRRSQKASTQDVVGKKVKSKAEIKAGLKVQAREKARLRKERRKLQGGKEAAEQKVKDEGGKKKRVSFAIA
ncbi:hypothetical protein PHSY_006820 [Pseudozyma hubeiensis SY62]|uniref:Uncharacterized protein n=1 Tax=Pseudozyma hubeiensis (strain SY62) TaxID=1305764 RepID=R9PM71_PSEHS|nr:hypothetical protein PHSY_006820 [Pseudozyma hubeiensis SY62]GAC99220.1 hypothetical protein PHSY_006820 [Pseudozyma hubeiensis SY62]